MTARKSGEWSVLSPYLSRGDVGIADRGVAEITRSTLDLP